MRFDNVESLRSYDVGPHSPLPSVAVEDPCNSASGGSRMLAARSWIRKKTWAPSNPEDVPQLPAQTSAWLHKGSAVVPRPEPKRRASEPSHTHDWTLALSPKAAVLGHAFNNRDALRAEILEQSVPHMRRTSTRAMGSHSRADVMGFDNCFARIVASRVFEMMSLIMILFNAVWIGVDIDFNDATLITESAWYFQLIENGFCCFFAIEWWMCMMASPRKLRLVTRTWFALDTLIAWCMIFETWIIPAVISFFGGSSGLGVNASIFRLIRLTRLTRLSRFLRAVPELVFMLKGLWQATRTVSCTMVLLLSVVYIFAVILRQLSRNTVMGEEHFSSVPMAMYTCIIVGTLLDEVRNVMNDVKAESGLCAFIFGMLIMFSALTVMNMLVGVLCEVVSQVAATEKERLLVASVKQQLRTFLEVLDMDFDGNVSKEEFLHLLRSPDASKALTDLGVDVVALLDSAEFLFQSDEAGQQFDKVLDFEAFMQIVLQLRGKNKATVRDVTELRKFMHETDTRKTIIMDRLSDNLRSLAANQQKIFEALTESRTPPSFENNDNEERLTRADSGAVRSVA